MWARGSPRIAMAPVGNHVEHDQMHRLKHVDVWTLREPSEPSQGSPITGLLEESSEAAVLRKRGSPSVAATLVSDHPSVRNSRQRNFPIGRDETHRSPHVSHSQKH